MFLNVVLLTAISKYIPLWSLERLRSLINGNLTNQKILLAEKNIQLFAKKEWISEQVLSLYHKIKYSNAYIFATLQCTPQTFQTYIILDNRIHCLKYQMATILGCSGIGIRKLEFVVKAQFLSSFERVQRTVNKRIEKGLNVASPTHFVFQYCNKQKQLCTILSIIVIASQWAPSKQSHFIRSNIHLMIQHNYSKSFNRKNHIT